ncbi:hypothetical protein GCM10010211_79900 [Streptomyces albospinus]|uniref:Uncharacterized protein n=1 Tax=Streptomyces albospinus TaxID=285515 RepID=A0ABQ2VNP0_9ACTN|nr:hypothetical protein GCM10010211_79900 [Streptomyces albospinus]
MRNMSQLLGDTLTFTTATPWLRPAYRITRTLGGFGGIRRSAPIGGRGSLSAGGSWVVLISLSGDPPREGSMRLPWPRHRRHSPHAARLEREGSEGKALKGKRHF